MKFMYFLVFMFVGILSFGSSSRLLAAPDSPPKSSVFDNDDLAKALAELGDDVPPPLETPDEMTAPGTSVAETVKLGPVDAEMKTTEVVEPTEPAEKEGSFLFQDSEAKYGMMRHLSEADVEILGADNGKKFTGVWNKDSFSFPGLKETEIQLGKNLFSEGRKSVITVTLLPKHLYRLRFNSVPPFSKINIQYRLQEPAASKVLNYMYLRVFVGKYELKRLQVSSKDSWLRTSISVGAVSFLNKDVPVAFEFATNQASGLNFSFIPEKE